MGVYIYTEEQEWQPGENTLLYLPLESDAVDQTENYTITNTNVTFNNNFGVFNGSNSKLATTTNFTLSGNPTAFTFSFWIYHTRNAVDVIFGEVGGGNAVGMYIESNNLYIWRYVGNVGTSIPINVNEWTHIVFTSDGTTTKVYKNGVQGYSSSVTYNITQSPLGIGMNIYDNTNPFGGYLSNFIVEDIVRTAQEIADYYNLTKSNYGL